MRWIGVVLSCLLLLTSCRTSDTPEPPMAFSQYEEWTNNAGTRFIAGNEDFTYALVYNQGLAEIDNQTQEAVWYLEGASPTTFILTPEGYIIYEDYDEQGSKLTLTDLYENTQCLTRLPEDFVHHMMYYEGFVYYYTSTQQLYRYSISDEKLEYVLSTSTLAQYLVIDEKACWYSNNCGLYRVDMDTYTEELIIDELVGAIQRVEDQIYYVIQDTPGIYCYEIAKQRSEVVCDMEVKRFLVSQTETVIYGIAPDYRRVYRYDETGIHEIAFELDSDYYEEFNVFDGSVYIRGFSEEGNHYRIYKITGTDAVTVLEE